jgi:hypothetical protein
MPGQPPAVLAPPGMCLADVKLVEGKTAPTGQFLFFIFSLWCPVRQVLGSVLAKSEPKHCQRVDFKEYSAFFCSHSVCAWLVRRCHDNWTVQHHGITLSAGLLFFADTTLKCLSPRNFHIRAHKL